MEKYNNYNLSKSEMRELRRIRRKGTVKVENTPELINLQNNQFLFWDDEADTLRLSEPYKNYRYNARREIRRKIIWYVVVPLITGLVLLLIEIVVPQLLTPAPSA